MSYSPWVPSCLALSQENAGWICSTGWVRDVLIMATAALTSLFADQILEQLGEGMFSRVVKCVDRTQPDQGKGIARHVAVKVIKNSPEYQVAAMIELRALKVCEVVHVCMFS